MKTATATRASEASTRERVLAVVVERGPVTTAELARALGLTAAAVRRHLEAVVADGLVVGREQRPGASGPRGPGRPAREFVATGRAGGGRDGHGDLAVDLLHHLAATSGPRGVRAYAEHRADQLRARYAADVEAAGPAVPDRAAALARALGRDGFAASTRPVDTGTGVAAVQLCQGRCPVQQAATAHPELCDAETEAFSQLLGVGTRRLATLGAGGRVCTTHVPLAPPLTRSPALDPAAQHRSTPEHGGRAPAPLPGGTAGETPGGAPSHTTSSTTSHTPSSPEGPRG